MANKRTENTKEKFGAAEKRGATGRGTGHLKRGEAGGDWWRCRMCWRGEGYIYLLFHS